MPHEGPLDLVREHPEIAVELVRGTIGVDLPGQLEISLAPTDMSAVVPVQYLADMGPVYVATARRVSKCPAAVLVVLCPDPAEAEKCRQPIRTGHPGFDLVPIVVDSGGPPGGRGRDGGSPYLTVFAASMGGIDMESEPGARRARTPWPAPASATLTACG
jgi:hypothetical protein